MSRSSWYANKMGLDKSYWVERADFELAGTGYKKAKWINERMQ